LARARLRMVTRRARLGIIANEDANSIKGKIRRAPSSESLLKLPPNTRLKLTAPVLNESGGVLKCGVVEFRLWSFELGRTPLGDCNRVRATRMVTPFTKRRHK